ncbi:unnamed protein product [Arabidopsis halleri]
MELSLKLQSFSFPSSCFIVDFVVGVKDFRSLNVDLKSSHQRAKRSLTVSPALAETTVSIAIAATVVGTAATVGSNSH